MCHPRVWWNIQWALVRVFFLSTSTQMRRMCRRTLFEWPTLGLSWIHKNVVTIKCICKNWDHFLDNTCNCIHPTNLNEKFKEENNRNQNSLFSSFFDKSLVFLKNSKLIYLPKNVLLLPWPQYWPFRWCWMHMPIFYSNSF